MNDYKSPTITYDKLIEMMTETLDCTNGNRYLDEYRSLNAQYESITKSSTQIAREEALLNAIKKLHKATIEVGVRVRETLEEELASIIESDMLTIPINYPHAQEARKLAAQEDFVNKLYEMTLPLEILTQIENIDKGVKKIEEIEDLANIFEEIEDSGIVDVTKEIEVPEVIAVEEPVVLEEIVESPVEEEKEGDTLEFNLPIGLPEEEVEEEKETAVEDAEKTSGKIKLIKKAIDKAKEKNNLQLVKLLEQQLIKETENI